jgi:BASS family bile acid:Na+ symporter
MRALGLGGTFALTLHAGLRAGPACLRWGVRHPRIVLRFLLAVWLGVPLLALVVTRLLHVPPLAAAVLLLMAICPGVPKLLSKTRAQGGRNDAGIVLLLATSATTLVLLPIWARVLSAATPLEIAMPPWRVLALLAPTVFVPLALGFAIRALSSRVADSLARVTGVIYPVGLLGTVAIGLIQGAPLLKDVPLRSYAAVAIVTLGASWMGRIAAGRTSNDRRTAGAAAALGNPALAFAMVSASYPQTKAGAAIAAYVVVRSLVLALGAFIASRATSKERSAEWTSSRKRSPSRARRSTWTKGNTGPSSRGRPPATGSPSSPT